MSFMVDLGKGTQIRFGSLEEARAFTNDVVEQSRIILGVFNDKRKANMCYQFKDIEVAGKIYKRGAYYL